MLVLTRKNNEQIRIADDITVTVLRIKGNTVRLGIEAPSNVRILRGELDAREAANSAQGDSMIIIEGTIEVPQLNADENPGGFIARDAEPTEKAEQHQRPLAGFREHHRAVREIIETKMTTRTGRPELPLLTDRISIPFSPRPSQPR